MLTRSISAAASLGNRLASRLTATLLLAGLLVPLLGTLPGCEKPRPPAARFVSSALVKGFDPVSGGDVYSSGAMAQVYEGLLGYHYLRRPVELEPRLAETMPEISDDGLTFTFRLRDDVYFQDNPCFPGGKGRKVVAEDFVYCMKRLMGVNDSSGSWVFEGKIAGLDDWADKCNEKLQELFDSVNEYYPFEHAEMRDLIDEEVEGIRAIDERTVQFVLTEPYPQFLWTLAMTYAVVYPREAVEHWGMNYRNHPVGTGPYFVEEYWPFDRRIIFEKNPAYREMYYPTEGEPGDEEKGLLADAGKRLPILDRVEFVMIEDAQPRWLQFVTGGLDRVETEKEIWAEAMLTDETGAHLRPELAKVGVEVSAWEKADIAYTAFNMDDPIFGHPAGEKGKLLRQAMCLAYNPDQWIDVMRNGVWATPADCLMPHNVTGYPGTSSQYAKRDLPRAKKLLAEAGYPDGKLPNGDPLTFTLEMSGTSTTNRYGSEIFKNAMKDIGITIELSPNTWDQFTEKIRNKRAQILGLAWVSDYPDAQNFLQMFYGPNESPGANNANFKNAEYDKLYDQMKVMLPSPERKALIKRMCEIVDEECPWSYTDYRTQYIYTQTWLKNFKWTEYQQWSFQHYNVDYDEKSKRVQERKDNR